MEKTCIEITDEFNIEEKHVDVIVKETGKPCRLPLSCIERYGNWVFLPVWLYKKIFKGEIACAP